MKSTPGYISRWDIDDRVNYAYFSNKQLKLSGSVLEYKVFGRHFNLDQKPTFSFFKNNDLSPDLSTELSPNFSVVDISIKDKVYHRARTKIRDYVNSNVYAYFSDSGRPYRPIFITLTFRNNISSLELANPLFTSFIQRFSLLYFDRVSQLRYLAVPEFQERGAVHYHCVFFNLPFRHNVKQLLASLWPYGFVNIRAVDRIKNLGRYISKYLSKDFVGQDCRGKKSYFVSRGLFKPVVTNYDEIISRVISMLPPDTFEYELTDIPVPYMVSMDYRSYSLAEHPKELEEIRSFMAQ